MPCSGGASLHGSIFTYTRTRLFHCGSACVLVALALLTTLALPDIRNGTSFLFFFPAVIFSAVIGGIGPGLLAVALAAGAVELWVRPDTALLLACSRAGRVRHSPELVATRQLVQETVDFLNLPPRFVEVAGRLPIIYTERVPLETVFRNLIQNAYKHHDCPDGGWVRISVQESERAVVFVIADDGPGIAPQYHERIVEIFQTLKPRDQVKAARSGRGQRHRADRRQEDRRKPRRLAGARVGGGCRDHVFRHLAEAGDGHQPRRSCQRRGHQRRSRQHIAVPQCMPLT